MVRISRDKRGMALLVVLAVLALLFLIGLSFVSTTQVENRAAISFAEMEQARMVCESALQIVLRDIYNDATRRWDTYGDERWYHFARDEYGNLCFGGTVSGVSGNALQDASGRFTPPDPQTGLPMQQYLAGLIVQPNVNRDETRLIWSCSATTLNLDDDPLTGLDLTGLVYPGDEYRVLGGYKLAVRQHTTVFPIGQISTNDSDNDGIPDAQRPSVSNSGILRYDSATFGSNRNWNDWINEPKQPGTYGQLLTEEMVVFDADEFWGLPDEGVFYSPPGSPAGNIVICMPGYYTTDEGPFPLSDPPPPNWIFKVPDGYVWVFHLGDSWMWVDQEVDLSGDGTPESKWISYPLADNRYQGDYTAYIYDDTAGRLCINMVGNTAGNGNTHHEGLGFDPFEINIERLIKGMCLPGREVPDNIARIYAQNIINERAGGNPGGYGLGDNPTTLYGMPLRGQVVSVSPPGPYTAGQRVTCKVQWTSVPDPVPFLGRVDWRLRDQNNNVFLVADNSSDTIEVISNGNVPQGTFSIVQASAYNPADPNSSALWYPFNELDEMEIKKNSPYRSRLEGCIVDAATGFNYGHDGVDNNGNSANTDGDADGMGNAATDYQERRWGYNPNDNTDTPPTVIPNAGIDEDGLSMDGSGNPNDGIDDDGDGLTDDADEVYCLHEEWDMFRHHVTTRFPAALSTPQKSRPSSLTQDKLNLNTATAADFFSVLGETGFYNPTVAGDPNRFKAAQLAAEIVDWRDADGTPMLTQLDADGDGTKENYYGVEPQPFINEIFWVDRTGDGPTQDDTYAVELYNPYPQDIAASGQFRLVYGPASAQHLLTATIPADGFLTVGNDDAMDNHILTTGLTDEVAGFRLDDGAKQWAPILLERKTSDGTWILVDRAYVRNGNFWSYENDGFSISPESGISMERIDPMMDAWVDAVEGRAVVDNEDTGVTVDYNGAFMTDEDGWCLTPESGPSPAVCYGGSAGTFLYNVSGASPQYVTFPQPALTDEQFDVFIFFDSSFATNNNVSVTVDPDGAGPLSWTGTVNQNNPNCNGGGWAYVTTQTFSHNGGGFVRVANDGNTGTKEVADAVIFVKHTLGRDNLRLKKGRRYQVPVKNRAFATIGELVTLLDPGCLRSADPRDGGDTYAANTNYAYTDDAALRFVRIKPSDGNDDDGDGVTDEQDEGTILLNMQNIAALGYNSADDNGDGVVDDVAEGAFFGCFTVHPTNIEDTRWFGRVNINTASRAILMALPGMGEYPEDGRLLADAIIRGRTPGGYHDITDLFVIANSANGADMPRGSFDGYDNDGDGQKDASDPDERIPHASLATRPPDVLPVGKGDVEYLDYDGKDNDGDGITDELGEGMEFFFTRIANVVTFRSEIFDVIVKARITKDGKTVAQAQLHAVVDRSTCDTRRRPRVLWKRWE